MSEPEGVPTLQITYENTPDDRVALYRLSNPEAPAQARSRHVLLLFVGISLAAVVFGELIHLGVLILILFVGFLVVLPVSWVQYNKRFWALARKSYASVPQARIVLHVDESGLREVTDGVESFAPWSSVRSYTVDDGTVFIELANGLWAIVPERSIGADDVARLVEVLRSKAVPLRESLG